jgi:hypothetical protein
VYLGSPSYQLDSGADIRHEVRSTCPNLRFFSDLARKNSGERERRMNEEEQRNRGKRKEKREKRKEEGNSKTQRTSK